jgi:hypothetical protein
VKGFFIELPFWPLWHPTDGVELRHVIELGIRTMTWLWEYVARIDIRANSYQEHTPTVLRHPEVPSVQDLPAHFITSESESTKLIIEEPSIRPVGHTIHVFDYKSVRIYDPKNSVKLSIKEID